ncbi:hypothetical protein GGI35DRAFT_149976 [Trichoderma velutinum]
MSCPTGIANFPPCLAPQLSNYSLHPCKVPSCLPSRQTRRWAPGHTAPAFRSVSQQGALERLRQRESASFADGWPSPAFRFAGSATSCKRVSVWGNRNRASLVSLVASLLFLLLVPLRRDASNLIDRKKGASHLSRRRRIALPPATTVRPLDITRYWL